MEQSTETWLTIPGYPDVKVSDQGQIWSIRWQRLLKQTKRSHGGHLVVGLSGRQWRVHQLVMLAFVGEVPDGLEVCHNDGNPENNCLSNLRYDSHLENKRDQRKHGTHPRGVDLGVATRFTEEDIRQIRRLRSEGLSYRMVAVRYGISDLHHIKKIIKKKIWGWVDDEKLLHQSRAYLPPTKMPTSQPQQPGVDQHQPPRPPRKTIIPTQPTLPLRGFKSL